MLRDTGTAVMDNPFAKKMLDEKLEAERDIVCLFAESCFLNILILYGDLSCLDRLEELSEALALAECRLHRLVEAVQRIGVAKNKICCLDDQEKLDLFEAHFDHPGVSIPHLEGVFRREDMREMLSDLSGSLQVK